VVDWLENFDSLGGRVPAAKVSIYRFGAFEYDQATGELRKNGLKLRLQEQPRQVLVQLLQRPGDIVSRDELQSLLWSDDTFVEFETGLNAVVKRLRETLGDSADNPSFIATLPRRGYRFIGRVERSETTAAKDLPTQSTNEREQPSGWEGITGKFRFYRLAGAAVVFVAAALFAVYLMTSTASPSYANLSLVPLTSYPGAELYPSFSPDGNEVVFAWNGGESGLDLDLYRKQIGSEKAMRLTAMHARRIVPAWSPDGRYIAYIRVRSGRDYVGLYLIPSLGGPERKLSDVSGLVWDVPTSLSWSPDSKWLAFPGPETSVDYATAPRAQIYLLNIETLQRRVLPFPSPTCTVALAPAFSQDGNEIASYCQQDTLANGTIHVQSVQGQTIRRFERINGYFNGLTWAPDGKSIVYSVNNSLWQQRVAAKVPEKLPFGQDANAPTVSRVGGRLAFARGSADLDNMSLWVLNLSAPSVPNGVPVRVVASSRDQLQPQISADGKRIAFVSQRSGNMEVWVANNDGSNLAQLSSFGATVTGTPRWAPDSRRIAFDSRISGHPDIYVVDASGGPPKRVLTGTTDASHPSWSHDGRWIYFAVNIGKIGIWKVPADGGVAIQLTTGKAWMPLESTDATRVYYIRAHYERNELASVSVNGTDDRRENSPQLKPGTLFLDMWTPGPNGIYFLTNRTTPLSLNLLNLSTGKIQHVADVPGRLSDWGSEPSLSADGHTLVFATADPMEGDLMMVEGLR
jgi:Tol biopolymer transport system component/DNA-binding winged helix-turn-helix (wHTH) protein